MTGKEAVRIFTSRKIGRSERVVNGYLQEKGILTELFPKAGMADTANEIVLRESMDSWFPGHMVDTVAHLQGGSIEPNTLLVVDQTQAPKVISRLARLRRERREGEDLLKRFSGLAIGVWGLRDLDAYDLGLSSGKYLTKYGVDGPPTYEVSLMNDRVGQLSGAHYVDLAVAKKSGKGAGRAGTFRLVAIPPRARFSR